MPEITLPTFHAGQIAAWDVVQSNRFVAFQCGRRWGKSVFDVALACDGAAKGEQIGIFAPRHKVTSELFQQIKHILSPIAAQSNATVGVFRTKTGGRIDIWSLENDPAAGRSRGYNRVIVDEAAFTKPNMFDIWQRAIRPTLLDYSGSAIVTSSTNGNNPDNFFYKVCTDESLGFKVFKAPTSSNPLIKPEDLENERRNNPPLVFKQEFEAEFIDWSGDAFFSLDSMLDDGKPITPQLRNDVVFAVIDTAVKTGKRNDGTAVVYFLYNRIMERPLLILDYDIVQIEGALLETWLPTVFQNLENFAAVYHCRRGSIGAHIEDQNAGSILIQQARRRGWPAQALDSKLTTVGKDERAVSVSGYVYRGMVGLTPHAHDKTMDYKGNHRNHFIGQVCGFHIGVDNVVDDLLDCFTYGISLALGDTHGF